MKRILCIVGSMDVGGAESFLMRVYRNLDRSRYQMDFAVATQKKGYYDEEILALGGKLHPITPKTAGIMKNFFGIRKLVRDNQYCYVLRTSQHALSALELLAAWLGGAKIRTFRSSNSNTISGSKKQVLIHKLCSFMPKWFANVRIAPSTLAAEFMFGKGCIQKGKAILMHNGLDLAYCHYDPQGAAEIRKELGVKENELVVGHIGRLSAQKNHTFLLKTFAEMVKERPSSKLLLVGMGELEQQLREQTHTLGIEKNVIFAGVRSDIPRVLSAMDVFVFPSLYEGMPNTVIEAQATGLPCVIADTITREADITGLVQYISLADTPEQWAKQALSAVGCSRKDPLADFVENKYDIQSVVDQFVQLCFGG